MKRSYRITSIVFLVLCFLFSFIIGALSIPMSYANAATNKQKTKDLSSYRKTYISDDNQGYNSTSESSLPFSALTNLEVKTNDTAGISFTTENGIPVIKLQDAKSFSVYLKCSDKTSGQSIDGNWTLSSDSWGSTQPGSNTQSVKAVNADVVTGGIGSGALIVQKSYDNNTYRQQTLSKFNNGLYTTDYLNSFHAKEKEVYTPSGDDIKQGVYITVNFYYEISRYDHTDTYFTGWQIAAMVASPIGRIAELIRGPQGKTDVYVYKNVRETYIFKVVEDNPEVATYNNLTTADKTEIVSVAKPSSDEPEEYAAQQEQYNDYLTSVLDQMLPTMYDGDMTTTGFKINVTSNPYLKVSLKRNGSSYTLPKLTTETNEKTGQITQQYYMITKEGRYDITIKSYSKTKKLTIYVDNVDANVAYQRYFGKPIKYEGKKYGDEFLNYAPSNSYGNMRIFDAYSSVPVFAGALTLNLQTTNSNALPLFGTIINKSTGATREVGTKTIQLTEYGEYELLFYTNKNYYDCVVLGNNKNTIAGDVRIYKFHFKLIGTTTGSTVNQHLLSTKMFADFSIASPSDYIPKFYGVSRTTAGKGRIIIAFASKEPALQYAKDVVIGDIEGPMKDGSGRTFWMVPSVNNPTTKTKSYSGWENAKTVKTLAEKMVEPCFFDMTDSSSYLTLEKTVANYATEGVEIVENLAKLPLNQTAIIWYDTIQRQAAIATGNDDNSQALAYIGEANIAILEDGNGDYDTVKEDVRDYFFVRDNLGIESYSLTVTDSQEQVVSLEYDKGLYAQLIESQCAPGIIQITEETIYGICSNYNVVFIPNGYQPAEISICCNADELFVSGNTYSSCRIVEFSNIIDPYSYVRVHYVDSFANVSVAYYSMEEVQAIAFDTIGKYELSLIDRFGNSTTLDFTIE